MNGIQYTIQFGKKAYGEKIDDWVKKVNESNAGLISRASMCAAHQAWAKQGM